MLYYEKPINSILIVPIITIGSAVLAIASFAKGKYDSNKNNKNLKINNTFEDIKNVLNDKEELIKKTIELKNKINNNEGILEEINEEKIIIEQENNLRRNKIKYYSELTNNKNNDNIYINLNKEENILDKTIDSENNIKLYNKNFESKQIIENEKIELAKANRKIIEINNKIIKLQKENENYNNEIKIIHNKTTGNIMAKLFSKCFELYLHNSEKITLNNDPSKIEEWKNHLNVNIGDKALETNNKMLDFSVEIIDNISSFLLKKNYNISSNIFMNFINPSKEKILSIFNKFNEIAEMDEANRISAMKNVADDDLIYFLKNISKYLKENKTMDNIEKILNIFNKLDKFKIDKDSLNIIFNKDLKNYNSIIKNLKQMQTILILYLICFYANKNNLALDKNRELTKKGIIEQIIYNNFMSTVPRVVITTLMNHGKLINNIFQSQGLEKIENDNSLLLKIGENLLNNNNEKSLNDEDIIKLILLTINNIEPENIIFNKDDLYGLSNVLNSTSILLTNITTLTV